MIKGIAQIALLVREYDEAIEFYSGKLGFVVVEDTVLSPDKRWVRLQAPGEMGSELLLARASNDTQKEIVGRQGGGRVLFFLTTDHFDQDYADLRSKGVEFVREPVSHDYGKVAVFKDLYGNWMDLIEKRATTHTAPPTH